MGKGMQEKGKGMSGVGMGAVGMGCKRQPKKIEHHYGKCKVHHKRTSSYTIAIA